MIPIMANNDTVIKTFVVAVCLCLACSIVVSTAAVTLKSRQQANKALDIQKNILSVAGLLNSDSDVQTLFEQLIDARIVDLDSGEFVDTIDAQSFDARKAAKDPSSSIALSNSEDIAGIKRRANYMPVYIVRQDGQRKYVILPIHGYGLWSTLYGFIALEADLNTVYGISFYQHAETPGLGGEVDNPNWQALWRGKQIYSDDTTTPQLQVLKGSVDNNSANARYQIDGLAGATITSRGVSQMLQFWFGERGYQTLLTQLQDS